MGSLSLALVLLGLVCVFGVGFGSAAAIRVSRSACCTDSASSCNGTLSTACKVVALTVTVHLHQVGHRDGGYTLWLDEQWPEDVASRWWRGASPSDAETRHKVVWNTTAGHKEWTHVWKRQGVIHTAVVPLKGDHRVWNSTQWPATDAFLYVGSDAAFASAHDEAHVARGSGKDHHLLAVTLHTGSSWNTWYLVAAFCLLCAAWSWVAHPATRHRLGQLEEAKTSAAPTAGVARKSGHVFSAQGKAVKRFGLSKHTKRVHDSALNRGHALGDF